MRNDWRSLFAHRHWFTLKVGNYSFRFCSRCSGLITGVVLFSILNITTNLLNILNMPIFFQIGASVILAIPAIIDWVTQSWRMRKSTNSLRYITGILEGVGISLLIFTPIVFLYKMYLLLIVLGITTIIGLLGIRKHSSSY